MPIGLVQECLRARHGLIDKRRIGLEPDIERRLFVPVNTGKKSLRVDLTDQKAERYNERNQERNCDKDRLSRPMLYFFHEMLDDAPSILAPPVARVRRVSKGGAPAP
jgi:hypothetical protein